MPRNLPDSLGSEMRKTPPPASTPPDYPRPAAPTLSSEHSEPPHAPEHEREHEHAYQQQEDDAPHKKKQGGGGGGDEHERRLRESALRKAEQNRPTRDFQATPKAVGAGGRIGQPAGKSFGV